MRVAARLVVLVVPIAGCSPLLGIEDPSSRGDAGGPDTPPDVAIDTPDHLDGPLELSLGDFRIARDQMAFLHVRVVHPGNVREDVTSRATLTSSAPAIATTMPGRVDGVTTGTATITATFSDAAPVSLKVTVSAALCTPVINEFMTGSGGDATNEFVELYNDCNKAINVATWTLNYRGGATVGAADSNTMITLAGSMDPGAIRTYGGSGFPAPVDGRWIDSSGMGSATGGVGLRDAGGALIDSVCYGDCAATHPFTETANAPLMVYGTSASRLPYDGRDNDNNMLDFGLTPTPTPRARNVP